MLWWSPERSLASESYSTNVSVTVSIKGLTVSGCRCRTCTVCHRDNSPHLTQCKMNGTFDCFKSPSSSGKIDFNQCICTNMLRLHSNGSFSGRCTTKAPYNGVFRYLNVMEGVSGVSGCWSSDRGVEALWFLSNTRPVFCFVLFFYKREEKQSERLVIRSIQKDRRERRRKKEGKKKEKSY